MQDVDQPRIAQLFVLLGEERLLELGAQLAQALADLSSHPADALGERLHRLKGSASSLGFADIAADLAAAENGDRNLMIVVRHAREIGPRLAAAIHESRRQR
jgi:HPt (histidine-containing phosphotransfer) domain-containing protein